MRPQCKRIYSALPAQCERICKRICEGRCEAPCVSDASPESRVQISDLGEGLNRSVDSPPPSFLTHTPALQREVWQILLGGLHSLSDNDYGRPWPYPDRGRLADLLARHDDDLCIRAARAAREIVQSQDRAPNITALFEKKLAELVEARKLVRDALAPAVTEPSNVEFIDFAGSKARA
jgi:hypothetical protein